METFSNAVENPKNVDLLQQKDGKSRHSKA